MSVLERDYARGAMPRLYEESGGQCPKCSGRGATRWFDADLGYVHETCERCSGVATAGLFVVQVETERFTHELRFLTDDFTRAGDRAERTATLFARLGGRCMGYRATEVRVVFKPLPAGPEEVVAAYAVPLPRNPRPTAA
jgi:hypothetical protein